MNDDRIIALYFSRDEEAIRETDRKYGSFCRTIARHILNNDEDTEETVNDVYVRLWNTIPPTRPLPLKPYIGTVCRNLSFDRYKRSHADKRGGGQLPLVLEELGECIADRNDDEICDRIVFRDAINRFLASLNEKNRIPFVLRYWYVASVAEIAEKLGVSEESVRMSLARTRKKLKRFLTEEEFLYEKE